MYELNNQLYTGTFKKKTITEFKGNYLKHKKC